MTRERNQNGLEAAKEEEENETSLKMTTTTNFAEIKRKDVYKKENVLSKISNSLTIDVDTNQENHLRRISSSSQRQRQFQATKIEVRESEKSGKGSETIKGGSKGGGGDVDYRNDDQDDDVFVDEAGGGGGGYRNGVDDDAGDGEVDEGFHSDDIEVKINGTRVTNGDATTTTTTAAAADDDDAVEFHDAVDVNENLIKTIVATDVPKTTNAVLACRVSESVSIPASARRTKTPTPIGVSGNEFDYLFKILIIGNSSVGKTCFLFRYTDDSFSPNFISTVGIDFKVKTVIRDGKKIKLQIWDTAGQERFRSITTSYYRGALGFFLLYDITKEDTFNDVRAWITRINTYAWENAQIVLVGNKADLSETDREVPTADAARIAENMGVPFFEVSAKLGINVVEAFETLVDGIVVKWNKDIEAQVAMEAKQRLDHLLNGTLTPAAPSEEKPLRQFINTGDYTDSAKRAASCLC